MSRYQRGVVAECQELELGVGGVPVVRGSVEESTGDIQLDRVPIVTPNCDIVVASLSIQVYTQVLHSLCCCFNSLTDVIQEFPRVVYKVPQSCLQSDPELFTE